MTNKHRELRDAFPNLRPSHGMGHRFVSDGDETRCMACDARPGGRAGSEPCPSGLDVFDDYDSDLL